MHHQRIFQQLRCPTLSASSENVRCAHEFIRRCGTSFLQRLIPRADNRHIETVSVNRFIIGLIVGGPLFGSAVGALVSAVGWNLVRRERTLNSD
jgi:hypothetical protein